LIGLVHAKKIEIVCEVNVVRVDNLDDLIRDTCGRVVERLVLDRTEFLEGGDPLAMRIGEQGFELFNLESGLIVEFLELENVIGDGRRLHGGRGRHGFIKNTISMIDLGLLFDFMVLKKNRAKKVECWQSPSP
tara:strand:+ start:804 stop:1202 length:399 start_codon:yes stop_codon:yes gene_type:complete